MTDGVNTRALPIGVEHFLQSHSDTLVAVVSEPLFERVPVETIHPSLIGFDEAPPLSNFGRATHAAVIQAVRSARLDGSSHITISLFGQQMHLTVVSLVGSPFLLTLLHPTHGIGECVAEIDSSGVTIYRGTCDSKTRLLAIDAELAHSKGIALEDSKNHLLGSLVHPDSASELLDCWVDSSALGASSCVVRLSDGADGEPDRWFQATLIANGEQTNFVFVDATNNPRVQRSQEHRSRLHTITEAVPQGIFRVSSSGDLIYKNSKLDDIFGRELVDRTDFVDLLTTEGEPLHKAIPRLLEESDNECVVEVIHVVEGQDRTIRVRVRSYSDPSGQPEFVGSAEDVTDEYLRSSQLEAEALTDPMTGTANRRALEMTLTELLEQPDGPQFAVLLCDLDGFKQVNDSLGHGAGDDVIAEVGRRLKEVSRDGDTVARLGGDEFVVVARNVRDYDHAMELAQRVLPVLRTPFMVADTQIDLSGSVGVAISSSKSTVLGVLQQADHAMYEAKRSGRNQAIAYETPDESSSISPLALRRDLRRAITDGGLDLAFQPIFAIHDLQNPVSAESLLRWDHPIQGQIDPGKMISIAEQSGLIRDLGEWIVTESIRSAAAVNANRAQDEAPISIAVNVSTIQVGRPEFGDMVRASLDFHELDPNLLMIELTETFLIDRVDNARESIESLTDIGVHFAVDDFGTGTSSFEYLLTLPVSAVKIDHSFTARLATPRGVAMLRGLSSACRELDMRVIAEGIETFDQLSTVRRAGVTHAQGYLLGMPVSTSNIGMRENADANRVA